MSPLQRDVKACLNVNKTKYEEEKLIGFYRIDFLVEGKTVIEVNGPLHYAF
jgi:very-short-patch-repair endonuclease